MFLVDDVKKDLRRHSIYDISDEIRGISIQGVYNDSAFC